jgi:uncharacterized repeat protein (TIGR04052 family)
LLPRTIVKASLACLCVSCGQPDLAVRIPFSASWNGSPVDCRSSNPALTDLRFYVNNVQLVDGDGRAGDMRYATEFRWQNDAVAIIDLENGKGACRNGNGQVFDTLIGAIPMGDYRGLRFTVGVPFRLNHTDPRRAIPPLDDPDMHGNWRSGYLFLRAGIRNVSDSFRIQVGSAGCEGTDGHISACRYPNRIEVYLADFVPGEHGVEIDLGALTAGTDLDDGDPNDCSEWPPEAACDAPFAALGIDLNSGEPTGTQRVFFARRLADRDGDPEPGAAPGNVQRNEPGLH